MHFRVNSLKQAKQPTCFSGRASALSFLMQNSDNAACHFVPVEAAKEIWEFSAAMQSQHLYREISQRQHSRNEVVGKYFEEVD